MHSTSRAYLTFITLLFIACFCFIHYPTEYAQAESEAPLSFTDMTADYWAYETVTWSISQQITFGFEDHTFRPNEPITEEQLLALVMRSFALSSADNSAITSSWSDSYYDLAAAHNYPISKKRTTLITRKYTAELLAATQGVHYKDKFAIQYLLDKEFALGVTSQTISGFQGNKLLTRAEALQLIKNLQEKSKTYTLQDRPQAPNDPDELHMPALLVERLHELGNAEQAVVVTASSYGKVAVKITAYERIDGIWSAKFTAKQGVIGIGGFSVDFHEGDKTTPEGIFSLKTAFGKYKNPGTKLPYQQTSANDYWVDDSQSPYYNTWQKGPARGKWNSAEHLLREDNLYDYAIVVNYNPLRVPGKGSAIFLHIWPSAVNGTLGCTAMNKSDLLDIMRWLNPAKHPILVQGTEDTVNRL